MISVTIKTYKKAFRTDMKEILLRSQYDILRDLWIDAMQEFVKAITAPGVIHLDTGMSKASIIPLGRAVAANYRTINKSIGAIVGGGSMGKKGYVSLDGTYHPDVWRTRQLGEQLGQKAFSFDLGVPEAPYFKFNFHIVVFQHKFHEPEWDSLAEGKAAFLDFYHQEFPKRMKVFLSNVKSVFNGKDIVYG